MILSVYLPHAGYDEEDHVTVLEVVSIIMEEEKAMRTKDFFIGGDLNIELKTRGGSGDLMVSTVFDLYGLYGLDCRGGGEDEVTYEKMRWLQLLKDFPWYNDKYLGGC